DNFFRSSTTTKRTGHCFMEHIFKKPTFCDVCNHMIVACGNKVDPVYEALRFGTSLAQKAKRPSGSESPHRHSVRDERELLTAVFFIYTFFCSHTCISSTYLKPQCLLDGPRKDLISIFVCSLSFSSRCRAGDRILLADDSNDDWWKGVIEDRIGFFPAAFAHQLQTGDQVFRCNRTFIGCKEQGQITLKEGEICVSKECEHSGFIIVSSGKKKGFVPCDVLEIL
uniref:SH3 and cysteine rich domain n=1 Tax=Gouania willdenowi TaxID=441366 RepID=A0A8C5N828_GOUWI